MNIWKNEKYVIDHVKIRDTGSPLPIVFEIEDGYRRGGLIKTDEGNYAALFGVSNIKVDEPIMNYEMQENENATPIYGLIIHNKKEAEIMSEFFKSIADTIEKQEGR